MCHLGVEVRKVENHSGCLEGWNALGIRGVFLNSGMQEQKEKVKILASGAITAKLRRMAYQIYEKNFGQTGVVLVGIDQRGGFVAQQLAGYLNEISPLKVDFLRLKKAEEGRPMEFVESEVAGLMRERVAVIVDDVLYSGYTMLQAVATVMEAGCANIQVAVLIDRGHRNVPVTHDFVGMVLATSLRQYVSVEVDEDQAKAAAYLF